MVKLKSYSILNGRLIKNLSITKKLAIIVFTFTFFLAVLAIASIIATWLLSGARVYVSGEGIYSKAQKDAVCNLYMYACSHNEDEFKKFMGCMKVPLAHQKARLELEEDNADLTVASQAFVEGGNHPEDARTMSYIFKYLRHVSYVDRAISLWADADRYSIELKSLGEQLHKSISNNQTNKNLQSILDEIYILNSELKTTLNEFSAACGEAARLSRKLLVYLIILTAVISITAVVLISLLISNDIRRKIFLLKEGADRILKSDYQTKIDVSSTDELGMLAVSFNEMSDMLLQTTASLEEKNKLLITTQKEMEKARDKALESSRLKTEFLSNMSHEIRTPMNAVTGFTDMLLYTNLDEEQINYAKKIKVSGQALLSLINDILDFSKIEAGELDIEKITFDIKLLVHEVCNLIRSKYKSKPIKIMTRISERISFLVTGDPQRYRQVLNNLMDNAFKFTESGEIELAIDIEDEKDDWIKIHATIRDTGIGIPRDKLETIFTPFQQADGSTTRKYGGIGLGLSIGKRISNHMDGDVWAESPAFYESNPSASLIQEAASIAGGPGSIFHFTAWLEKQRS
jgi:signal transduction histidine kinase